MPELNDAVRFALTGAGKRQNLYRASFQLDAVLGTIALSAREPLLAQIRMAWWRDQLKVPEAGFRAKDPLVRSLAEAWGTDASQLIKLVDGWESLIDDRGSGSAFVESRADFGAAIAKSLDCEQDVDAARMYGALWAFSDLTNYSPHPKVREWAIEHWKTEFEVTSKTSVELRPLAILGGLARRSLERGGTPMLGDRKSPFVALRFWFTGK